MTSTTTARITKIRAGLYLAIIGHDSYDIEDRADLSPGVALWRVTDLNLADGWVGDYATKREAIAAIDALPHL